MKKAGILPERIICEKESGRDMNRPIWLRLKHRMRSGDTITIMSIDRLGRNYDEILKTWRELTEKGIGIVVLDMPILNTAKAAQLCCRDGKSLHQKAAGRGNRSGKGQGRQVRTRADGTAAGMGNTLQKSRSRRTVHQGSGNEARSFTHHRLPMGTGIQKGGTTMSEETIEMIFLQIAFRAMDTGKDLKLEKGQNTSTSTTLNGILSNSNTNYDSLILTVSQPMQGILEVEEEQEEEEEDDATEES